MKILITGLGITDKSSFLKWIANFLKIFVKVSEVIPLDLDYQRDELPKTFNRDLIYLLEDVHGPTSKAIIPLSEYDLVFYLLPGWLTHLRFWLYRMKIWYENGTFAWDADKGPKGAWAGNARPNSLRNLPGILKYFWNHFPKRARTIGEDMVILKTSRVTTIIVTPTGKWGQRTYSFKTL